VESARRQRRTLVGRPFGVLFGWDVRHPFRLRPSYEAVDHPREPNGSRRCATEVRERILREEVVTEDPVQVFTQAALIGLCRLLRLAGEPDYEQPAAQSLMAMNRRGGRRVRRAGSQTMAR
jgi:hypothetical protein